MKYKQSFQIILLVIGVGISALGVGLFALGSPVGAADNLFTEDFRSSSTQPGQWIYGGLGAGVCLTAGDSSTPSTSIPACSAVAIDTNGSGVLRLTNDMNNQSGYVILNTPLNSRQGFRIGFDMYQYSNNANHADGIGFIIIDGSVTPLGSGGMGGSLGYGRNIYRQATGSTEYSGIAGGYVGIGLDAYGNFSSQSCPGPSVNSTCDGFLRNAIGVRSSQQTQYQFVGNKAASGELAVRTTVRDAARRTVVISVSPSQKLSVTVDYYDGRGPIVELDNLDLGAINGDQAYPETFKVGIAGSTGGTVDYHEVRNLFIETLDPDLTVDINTEKTAFYRGERGSFIAEVRNLDSAAPTLGTITAQITLPESLTLLGGSGNGWSCVANGQTLNCSRPGAGASALISGNSAPAITVNFLVKPTAVLGVYDILASTNTTGDSDSSNNQSLTVIDILDRKKDTASVPGVPNTSKL